MNTLKIKNRFLFHTIYLVFAIFIIASCNKDKDDIVANDQKIVGKWQLEKVDYQDGIKTIDYEYIIEFTMDKKLKYAEAGLDLQEVGTYKVTGNKIEYNLQYEDGNEIEYYEIVELTNTNLVTKLTGFGDGSSFTKEINYFNKID